MIRPLPSAPSRDDPSNFSARADALLGALDGFVDDCNALEQSLQLVATTGTSATSITVSTGAKELTTQVGKAWSVGSFVYLASAASTANLMVGQVTGYNPTTGTLNVAVTSTRGSGTFAAWVIGLSAPDLAGINAAVLTLLSSASVDAMRIAMGAALRGANDDITSLGALATVPTVVATAITAGAAAAAAKGPTVQGAFKNLQASASGTSASVAVSADELVLEDVSNNYVTLRALSLTISSAGAGASGLDTGTLAATTWYSVWAIWNGTTAAGLLSLSATAPTMPSGYTHKARVGWIRTDGTANKYPIGFNQKGRTAQLMVGQTLASGVVSGTVAVSVSAFVPSTASRISLTYSAPAVATANGGVGPNASFMYFTFGLGGGAYYGSTVPVNFLLEGPNVYYQSNSSSVLALAGWEDNL